MALSLVAVGAKITAAIVNAIINLVNANGVVGIVPSSIAGSGVTLGASGKVAFAAATTVSVNGCFTSTYDNYRIVIDLVTSASTDVTMQLRLAGANAATAYDRQGINATNTTVSGFQSLNATSWALVSALGVSFSQTMELELRSPALPVATLGLHRLLSTPNPMTTSAGLVSIGYQHRTATAYDGFTIAVASGTITGTIRVYGWNNN